MRFALTFAAAVAVSAVPAAAQTVAGSVEAFSRYIDTTTFNTPVSNDPMVRLNATIDLGDEVYVDGYVYSGFENPLSDDSSEYGIEAGKAWTLSESSSVTVAAGRYANYFGQGFNAGDWYLRGELAVGAVTVEAGGYWGDSDTAVLGISYEIPVGDRVTVKPTVKWITAYDLVNPGVEATVRINDRLSLKAIAVLPDGGYAKSVYATVGLSCTF